MNTKQKTYLGWGVTAFLLFLAIYYWEAFTRIAGVAFSAASPLLMGCVIAYIVNILMSAYERHYFPRSKKPAVRKSARPVCMIAAFLTAILIVVLVIRLVVPELVSCVQLLFAEVPKAMDALADWLAQSELASEKAVEALQGVDWDAALETAFNFLKSGVGSTVNFAIGAVSSVISSVMTLFISLIFSIYLLMGKERLLNQFGRLLKNYVRPAWVEKLRYGLSVLNESFHRYIVGQFTEAFILGALCALGMLLLGFPYAVMTGAVIGVTALIPIAGAWIGGAVGFILILSVSPVKAVLFIVYLLVLQQIESNLIYPRVVGSSLGLPGIWVLAAVTVGGGILGVTGMLLGVPLAAAAYQLLRNDMRKNEQRLSPQS